MALPVTYASRTARFDLPLLFAGQAQKEFTVNDALTRISSLMHPAVEGESASPPPSAAEGDCWLVAAPASGEWEGQEQAIACYTDGNWSFLQPAEGMRCYDKAAGRALLFDGAWQRPDPLTSVSGGATQDAEARSAIAELIAALGQSGLI